MSQSDFPEFDKAYYNMLLPENADVFDHLAAQANFNIYHNDLWHGTARRFAELIVQECANLYTHDDVMAPVGQSAYGEAYQDGWIEGTKAYREIILNHFGVKE